MSCCPPQSRAGHRFNALHFFFHATPLLAKTYKMILQCDTHTQNLTTIKGSKDVGAKTKMTFVFGWK